MHSGSSKVEKCQKEKQKELRYSKLYPVPGRGGHNVESMFLTTAKCPRGWK